ncbi:ligase-associated DNA damage response DEXH box helicase [Lacibacterium aquatile]|uniref:Ligase-associated DNA damage response DEXH box helicase n=1 Tax=Lacibacterium aquatile TaxID=1168082 RepID=A0ABW5DX18_9PROT
MTNLLPTRFTDWFARRGWSPRDHQLALLAEAKVGRDALLIAPTGGGKTLAGFLPSLVDLSDTPSDGLHTLYISPLKALAVDIARNLDTPIAEMNLGIRAETRTGDTPANRRARQKTKPPHLLMTTPESLALLLSHEDAPQFFASLKCIILDELHALAGTKRGELLALGLARLTKLAPAARRIGLSATVAHEDALLAYLSRTGRSAGSVSLVRGGAGARAEIGILDTKERLPWAGHMAAHAIPEIFAAIKAHRVTLVFVNTRAQAEIIFQELWRLNEETLPIGLHHGSLAAEQRRKVEAAMAAGRLRAVVATSSLDLGIDWGDIDLVIQVGAPKGSSRLLQRIGRANHRLDAASKALLVPGNRFEVLECRAAFDAVDEGTLDGDPPRKGGLDVLAQHVLGMGCSQPFQTDDLYAEVTSAAPYADLPRATFDQVVGFVATGGYSLRSYERFHRLEKLEDGRLAAPAGEVKRRYRMNIGTIVEAATMKVRLQRGPVLGEIEEYFVEGLRPGDTFLFAGQLLRFNRINLNSVECSKAAGTEPKIPAYMGGRLPLSTHLADRVRAILATPEAWDFLPGNVQEWLNMQRWRSELPRSDGLLVETFPRGDKQHLIAYSFAGRNAHQTMGMLLTRRMERMGLGPLGFVGSDYALSIWSLRTPTREQIVDLFDEDMLGDDLEEWMAESALLRRTFRTVAVIAGLIDRKMPGQEKTGRQITFNSDLIYDVLRRHEPDHILLQATRQDAASGLTDIARIADLLARVKGRIRHRALKRVSPLAVPAILEIGREAVYGAAMDDLLDEAAAELIEEAMGGGETAELPL